MAASGSAGVSTAVEFLQIRLITVLIVTVVMQTLMHAIAHTSLCKGMG